MGYEINVTTTVKTQSKITWDHFWFSQLYCYITERKIHDGENEIKYFVWNPTFFCIYLVRFSCDERYKVIVLKFVFSIDISVWKVLPIFMRRFRFKQWQEEWNVQLYKTSKFESWRFFSLWQLNRSWKSTQKELAYVHFINKCQIGHRKGKMGNSIWRFEFLHFIY